MTTIMNQVTCSLCVMKTDELQWKMHIISRNHLQRCKKEKDGIAIRFLEMIFRTYHSRKHIYNLENEKTKLSKEKFDISCNNINKKTEIKASLTSGLLHFIKNCTYDVGESCFDSLDKITICRICNSEVHKSLLYDHIKSKEHREIEIYFMGKCMTYCEQCNEEVQNDERRQHIISGWHSIHYGQRFCVFCKKQYTIDISDVDTNERDRKHLECGSLMKN